jgi:hypothetical protein
MKDFIIKLLLAAIAVLSPIKTVIIATGVVIILDLISGVVRAVKAKEAIQSSVMRRTVTKFLVYQLAIISGFIIETYLLSGIPITKLVSSVIGLVEIKSILENLNDIYGQNIFKSILDKLGSDNSKSE